MKTKWTLTTLLLSCLTFIGLAQSPSAPNYTNEVYQQEFHFSPTEQLKVLKSTFVVDTLEKSYIINENLELLLEDQDTFSLEEVLQAPLKHQFQDFSTIDTLRLKPPMSFWARIVIKNNLEEEVSPDSWILFFFYNLTDVQFYQLDSLGYQKQRTGLFVPLQKRNFAYESDRNLVRLSIRSQEEIHIYFRAESNVLQRFRIPPLRLAPLEDYQKYVADRRLSSGLFSGFIFMILLYSFILFLFEKDSAYLHYSCYLVALMLWYNFNRGELGGIFIPLFFKEHPHYIMFFKYATYIGFFFYLRFLSVFLDLKKQLPTWNRIFKGLIWLGCLFFIVDFYVLWKTNFSLLSSDRITVTYILIFILSTTVFLYPLYKIKDKKSKFILLGVLGMDIGLLTTAYLRFAPGKFTLLYFQIGTIIEVVVFFIGLAYRRKQIAKQRQEAEISLAKSKLQEQLQEEKVTQQKELSKIKNRLYTNITHEFRTPLTVISGMAEQMEGRFPNKTELIKRNSKSLLNLVNQLLELSKLESGKSNLDLQRINVVEFIKKDIQSYIALATSNDINTNFDSFSPSIEMDIDLEKMRQILANLLSNAIKFSPEKEGKISVSLAEINSTAAPQLKLSITDNGDGIPEEELPHIFDRFYQAKHANNKKTTGTGIGLALTKELVNFMGGSITASNELDKGATFTVLLPITRNAPAIAVSSITWLGPGEEVTDNYQPAKPAKTPNFEDPEHPFALIIEDNKDIIQYLVDCLKNDYHILTAPNGKEGIKTAIEKTPDIIISDVMMPEADGYEVVNTLKNDERSSHIPIILLTARADQDSKLEGLESGADAYLAKPFDKKELMIRLAKMISLRKTLYAKFASPEQLTLAQSEKKSKEDVFLIKLKTAIEAELGNSEYNVELLAKGMNLSRSQLFRKTKALTGQSISAYMRLIRLHHGKALLRKGRLTVAEVAYKVGFSDPGYFSKCYSEVFGYAPSGE